MLKRNTSRLPNKFAVLFCCISVFFLWNASISLNDNGNNSISTYLHGNVCDCGNDDISTAILYFQKPWRRFHGNHWFHIGEYYLSRHKQIASLLNNKRHNTVKIITHETHLSSMMTSFTFFLVSLSIEMHNTHSNNSGHIRTNIELYAPLAKANMKELKRLQACQSKHISTSSIVCGSNNHNISNIFEFKTKRPVFSTMSSHNQLHPRQVGYEQESDNSHELSHAKCNCGMYVGSVGETPINTTEWFKDSSDVRALQSTAQRMCSMYDIQQDLDGIEESNMRILYRYQHAVKSAAIIDTVNSDGKAQAYLANRNTISLLQHHHSATKKIYNMLIYQRDKNRKFADLPTLLSSLAFSHSSWNIDVVYHNEKTHPCMLQKLLSNVDIFLTTHGFQCTALIFMPPGATLIEVFPYKYYKSTYVTLTKQFQLKYLALVNTQASSYTSNLWLQRETTESCMSEIKCRSYARYQSVVMTREHIRAVISVMDGV